MRTERETTTVNTGRIPAVKKQYGSFSWQDIKVPHIIKKFMGSKVSLAQTGVQ